MLLDRCRFNVDCSQIALENGAHTALIPRPSPLSPKEANQLRHTCGQVSQILASESAVRNNSYWTEDGDWN